MEKIKNKLNKEPQKMHLRDKAGVKIQLDLYGVLKNFKKRIIIQFLYLYHIRDAEMSAYFATKGV